MKHLTGQSQAVPVPAPLPSAAPALPFPRRSTIPQLRQLRDKLFREGKCDISLQVATEVARRDPGRHSYCRLGMIQREVGRYREALGTLRDALRFESGPAYMIPEIHLHIAHTWFLLGKRKRVGESIRRAYARRPKPRTAFKFHLTYGNFLFERKEWRAARQEYRNAELAAPDALSRGRAAINQGMSWLRERHLKEALEPIQRAIRILKRAGSRNDLATARLALAWLHLEEGQWVRGMGMCLNAAAAYHRMGRIDREAEALTNAGYAAVLAGSWLRAGEILDRAIGLASAVGKSRLLIMAYSNRAIASARLGHLETAFLQLIQARRLLRGKRDWIGTLHVCRAQATLASLEGRWREMFRASRQGERLALKEDDVLRVMEFRTLRSEAELHLGRKRAATQARKSAEKLSILLKTSSPVMKRLVRTADRVAKTDLPVLLLGESGAGLLDLARKIHASSPRKAGPCEIVACEQLVFAASDLQGHAEGAWSGAGKASIGLVSRAQGGTLVLDRVDQLGPEVQRILVRLVEGKTRGVGETVEKSLDCRVIATAVTTDPLIPELRRRLEGAVFRLPALRERAEEIPDQVRTRLAGRREITPDALAELTRHPWKGNLAELQSTVDRLVALSDHRIGRKLVLKVMSPETRRVARRVYTPRKQVLEALAAL